MTFPGEFLFLCLCSIESLTSKWVWYTGDLLGCMHVLFYWLVVAISPLNRLQVTLCRHFTLAVDKRENRVHVCCWGCENNHVVVASFLINPMLFISKKSRKKTAAAVSLARYAYLVWKSKLTPDALLSWFTRPWFNQWGRQWPAATGGTCQPIWLLKEYLYGWD